MMEPMVVRDERTQSVENASYRWAYLVLSFGLLLSTMYRSFVLHQQAWDLLALVIVGGVVATTHQGLQRVLTRRWLLLGVAGALAAAVLAFLLLRLTR